MDLLTAANARRDLVEVLDVALVQVNEVVAANEKAALGSPAIRSGRSGSSTALTPRSARVCLHHLPEAPVRSSI